MKFSNSRTFPGQGYACNAFIASAGTESIGFFILVANFWAKCRTKSGISSARSRSGGTLEPVVQVAPEPLLLHHLAKVAVRGRHHTHIHPDRTGAAQALEFLLLQHPQKFDLQFERNFAHFIEENRSAIGQFEAADLGRDGPGERAFFMTK
jgi:hypothetical protein